MKFSIKKSMNFVKHVAMPCLLYGTIVGLFVGSVVFAFKLGTHFVVEKSEEIFHFVSEHPLYVPVFFAALIILALAEHFIQKWAPETEGICIPRAEGATRGILPLRWIRTSVGIMANSFISFFAGLPLGSEGPSVLLGTSLAGGATKLPLSKHAWRRYVMTGGACAGFAVVTGAPLTGVLFGMEEAHKRFTPTLALMCTFSVISAYLTSALWTLAFGMQLAPWTELANVAPLGTFEIGDVGYLVILGLAIGIMACIFNFLIFKSGKFVDKRMKRVPQWLRMVSIFVIVGIVGLFLIDAIYSGHHTIELVGEEHFEVGMLILLFVVKFILVILCFSVNATGDLCVPMFALGALMGGVFAALFVAMGMDASLVSLVVLISMSAFMGTSTRAPITAIVFIVECSWSFTNIFYVAIVVFIAMFIAEILKVEPLYDVVIERMVHHLHHGKETKIYEICVTVQEDAYAEHKYVRDILWPENTIVLDICADDAVKHMDNSGERKFFIGNKVTIQAETFDLEDTKFELCEIFGKQEMTATVK